jgi:SH2 domain
MVLCRHCFEHIHALPLLRWHRPKSVLELRPVGSLQIDIEKDLRLDDASLQSRQLGVSSCRAFWHGVEVELETVQVDERDDRHVDALWEQMRVLRALRGTHVQLVLGASCSERRFSVVSELCHKDCATLMLVEQRAMSIRDAGWIPLWRRIELARQTALGIVVMHKALDGQGRSAPVAHRALDLAHVLVDASCATLVKLKMHSSLLTGEQCFDGAALALTPQDNVAQLARIVWQMCTLHAVEHPTLSLDVAGELADVELADGVRQELADGRVPERLVRLLASMVATKSSKVPSIRQVANKLLAVVMELLIANKEARRFWRQFDPRRLIMNVEWRLFAPKFYEFIGATVPPTPLDDIGLSPAQQQYRLFRELLRCDADGGQVDIDLFGSLIEAFSSSSTAVAAAASSSSAAASSSKKVPLKTTSESLTRILETIRSLCSKPWFHGHMSSIEADNLLARQHQDSYFLVRFSASSPGNFCVSYRAAGGTVLHRIVRRPSDGNGQCYLSGCEDMRFSSLVDLVFALDELLGVDHIYPLGNNPFLNVFELPAVLNDGYYDPKRKWDLFDSSVASTSLSSLSSLIRDADDSTDDDNFDDF